SQEAADQLGVDASEAFGSGVAGTEASEAEPGRGRTRGRRPAKPAAGLAGVDADGSGRSSPAGPGTDGPGERRPSLFEPRSVSPEAATPGLADLDAGGSGRAGADKQGVAGGSDISGSGGLAGLGAGGPDGRRPATSLSAEPGSD